MNVCFFTFGCRLNKAEALLMEAEYLAKGWKLTDKHKDADLFVVRGCSVTSRAQHECEKLIGHLKRHYPSIPVRVCGCLEKKDSDLARLKRIETLKNAKNKQTPPTEIPVPTRTARAYLKVQDGCAGKCTFCIVPKFRGVSASVDFTEVIDRARRFIDAGYHEIVVTGCNLSLYASQGKRLPELLAALAELTPAPTTAQSATDSPLLDPTACRIRLGSIEPGVCALETVHAMAEHPNVCRFLHIPIQSGSNKVLIAMRRPYIIRDVETLVETAQQLMPRLGLGCDLMTGFPGESDLDFAATAGLIKRLPFNNAHVFPYSKRPGTLAAGFPRAVEKEIRTHRAHELSRKMRTLREKFAQSFVGKTVQIVVEEDKKCSGWTSEYLKCEAITGTAPRKSIATLFVTKSEKDQLYGRLKSVAS